MVCSGMLESLSPWVATPAALDQTTPCARAQAHSTELFAQDFLPNEHNTFSSFPMGASDAKMQLCQLWARC